MPAPEPFSLAPFLKEYGGWGFAALMVPALYWALRGWFNCLEARISDGTTLIAALTEAKLTNAAVVAALESRIGYFERLGNQVESASQATEVNLTKIAALLAENQRTLDDLRRGRL